MYALIVDALSLPYGALTLPLDISVFCRADLRSILWLDHR